ncbi:CesT family type III secretion system chaperone [Paraburkholderia sediminicola]|uniref:CesT family type III secretion system chaperone n=1 Tax=Paraburkholderia sediminicola TaxID=458836 RepID=UPI0038BAADEB
MNISQFQRVVEELCQVVGFESPEALIEGGFLQVDDNFVSMFYNDALDPDVMQVFIDLGPMPDAHADAYKTFMKLNFELSAGQRGALSLHPNNGNLFYSFRYRLDEEASGQRLLDALIRFVADLGVQALALS